MGTTIGWLDVMLWVPKKHPQALVFSTHFLASLLSMFPCL